MCPEAVTYGFVNIGLAGEGILEGVQGTNPNFLVRLRNIATGSPGVITVIFNGPQETIEIGFNGNSLKQQQTAVDTADRNSKTPAFLGQMLVQTNTFAIYVGNALVPGGWLLKVA